MREAASELGEGPEDGCYIRGKLNQDAETFIKDNSLFLFMIEVYRPTRNL